MGEDALMHVRSSVGLFARARGSLHFLVAMPGGQADHLQNNCDGEDDCRQDGSSSSSGRQADGGSGMDRGVQAAEGWGVRPGSRPPSGWLARGSNNWLASQ